MPNYLCVTCGTEYAETIEPPACCKICDDPRQFLGSGGQQWTTAEQLAKSHWNTIRELESSPDEAKALLGLGIAPHFAIGQRAILIRRPEGNILWDCVPLLDKGLITAIRAMGGLTAIAISHPHYYANVVAWCRAFDCPVYLHAADQEWVMRPDPSIQFWEGEIKALTDGLTLHRLGGHFAGGTVLHWESGTEGRSVLLSGDIVQVVPDRGWVSFMYSYPNYIPLPASVVRRITTQLEPLSFDRIYGAFWNGLIPANAKQALRHSADRYLAALDRELSGEW